MSRYWLLGVCLSAVLICPLAASVSLAKQQSFGDFLASHVQTKAAKYVALKESEWRTANNVYLKAQTAKQDAAKAAKGATGSAQNIHAAKALALKAETAEAEAKTEEARARKAWDNAAANAHKWTTAEWTKIEAEDKARLEKEAKKKVNALDVAIADAIKAWEEAQARQTEYALDLVRFRLN